MASLPSERGHMTWTYLVPEVSDKNCDMKYLDSEAYLYLNCLMYDKRTEAEIDQVMCLH